MARVRTLNIDLNYDQAEVVAALNLIIALTGDIATALRPLEVDVRRAIWQTNATSRALGQKLLAIDRNLDDMDPRP